VCTCRPAVLADAREQARELFWCFLRHCSLGAPLSRDQLGLMSAAFHFAHGIYITDFDYMGFVTKSLGFDATHVVGLGIIM
jgi:hypothetical protein